MQYISFYKNRLPFKPRTNVVIYFDVTGIGMKRYYGVINDYYDRMPITKVPDFNEKDYQPTDKRRLLRLHQGFCKMGQGEEMLHKINDFVDLKLFG